MQLLALEPVLELVRLELELPVGFELGLVELGLAVESVGFVVECVRVPLVVPRFVRPVAQFAALTGSPQVVVPTGLSAVDSSVGRLSVHQSDSAPFDQLAQFVAPSGLTDSEVCRWTHFSAYSAAALIFVGVGSTALVVDT